MVRGSRPDVDVRDRGVAVLARAGWSDEKAIVTLVELLLDCADTFDAIIDFSDRDGVREVARKQIETIDAAVAP